jgi:hypothetical protein|tara:strand:+ start:6819 stop:7130 length:312 start_codon:yes stop_codon:yes gene_type:complete
MKQKNKELAAMYGDPNKITRGDIITAAKKKSGKKEYNNGQRKSVAYGGNIRKPMMLGGLAEQNKSQGVMTPKMSDGMGMMTQQKKFGMGYNLGGAIKKFEGRK